MKNATESMHDLFKELFRMIPKWVWIGAAAWFAVVCFALFSAIQFALRVLSANGVKGLE